MNNTSEKAGGRHRLFRKGFRILGTTVLVLEIVFVTAALAAVIILSIGVRHHQKQMEYLTAHGPWAEESIWVSQGKDVYFISEKDEDDILISYWKTFDGEWCSYYVDWHGRSSNIQFCQGTPDLLSPVFQCSIDMDETEELCLYDFDLWNSNKEVPLFDDLSVTLYKQSYDSAVSELPFTLN